MKISMKKIMAVLCAMLMLCALAACGDNSSNNNNNNNQQAEGPSAYELYTQASEKMNGLAEAEYDMNVDMTIDIGDGQSYAMTMGGNMKQVKTGEADTDFDLAFAMVMDMSAMGAGTMNMDMYYHEGYLYYDMSSMGAGTMKVAMDIDAAEDQMKVEGMADIDESWIKDSSVDGNNIHLVVDGTQMSDYVDQYAESMTQSLGEATMTMGDVTIDLTTDAEGMPTTYKMTMPLTISAQGETMTMDMAMTLDLLSTSGVSIEFPADMESYQEVDASLLQ